MEQKKLHIIDVEPNDYMMYVDGEIEGQGHSYMKEDDLVELLEREVSYKVTSEHIHYDRWKGVPDTLEEAMETYENVEGP